MANRSFLLALPVLIGGLATAVAQQGGVTIPGLRGNSDTALAGGTAASGPAAPADPFTGGLGTAPDAPAAAPARPVRRAAAPPPASGRVAPVAAARPLEPMAPAPVVPPGLRQQVEDPLAETEDPYRPVGLRAGTYVLLPAIEATAGYTSNIEGRRGGQAGPVFTVAPELRGRSDWSRHALDFDLRGAWTDYPTAQDYSKPTVSATVSGRVDIAEEMRLDLRAGYAFDRQAGTSADNPRDTAVPENIETLTGSAGFTRSVGVVALTLRGDVTDTRYSGGTTTSGAPLPGDGSRDNTLATGAVRVGYAVSPAFKPYAELQVTRRVYADAASAGRDADGYGLRGGVEIDTGPILKGDFALGWSTERPADRALDALSGLTVDGSLVWSPTRLTKVTLTAKTAFEATTLAGSPGSVARSLGVKGEQSFTRELAGEAELVDLDRRYEGVDRRENTLSANAALIVKVTPQWQNVVRVGWSRFTTSAPGENYQALTVGAGVRLQQ
jgi:hypothetical protein